MIHPTAVVSEETILGEWVVIWPYVVLQGKNIIGDGVQMVSHVRVSDSVIGKETVLTAFAKIESSTIWERCKIGCELRKCVLWERVQASHTNIVLEKTYIQWYTNIASGTVFWVRWGHKTEEGAYIKWSLHIWTRVFVGLNVSFFPWSDQSISIGDEVFIAGNIALRHDVPAGHTVYPTGLVKALERKGKEFEIVKETEEYCILNWNKMKEENIMKDW